MELVNRIRDKICNEHDRYGVRQGHEAVIEHLRNPQLQVERYLSAMPINEETRSPVSAGDEVKDHSHAKKFRDQAAAMRHLVDKAGARWMTLRGLNGSQNAVRELRQFVKDIFEAIDLDGSGTMDQEELIKALLCMGLSQDIQFAQRIIKVFRENQEKAAQKALERQRLFANKNDARNAEPEQAYVRRAPVEFTFRDFLSIFEDDDVGQ